MDLNFTKMHGAGNDFIVIEDLDGFWEFDELAVQVFCDRHFGIGADGMILVRPATDPDADYFMLYMNADGSVAEMCGNGVRCFARFLVENDLAAGDEIAVQTLGGIKRIEVLRDEDGAFEAARVDMGRPAMAAADIPTTLPGDPVIDATVSTELGDVTVTCVSMGNPHAITFVEDADAAPVLTLGPLVETAPDFPNKTNVEFAEVIDEENIRLRVWERGVGETLACGTGACATLVAAALTGRTGRSATVELPGGELEIEWAADDHVFMTGPAEVTFEGVVRVEDDDE